MLKYMLWAATLKAFSCNAHTRRLYRKIGNNLGTNIRVSGKLPNSYFSRVKRMLERSKSHGIPQDGDRLLELGTGWVHWEAVTMKLFFDIQGVLFDVWDNRQMDALKSYVTLLDDRLEDLQVQEDRRQRAHRLIAEIKEVKDFEALYELLSFEYVMDPGGVPNQMEPGSFDVITSAGVMEHISAEIAPDFVNCISTLLKPGGHSVHGINMRDHFYQYDKTVSPKQYLQYSEKIWKILLENQVQYINRLQRSDWLKAFEKAGLVLVNEEMRLEDLTGVRVAKAYQAYDETDLRCGGLRIIHRKPPQTIQLEPHGDTD